LDPLIKSQLLYQLSYAPEMRRAGLAKARSRRRLAKLGWRCPAIKAAGRYQQTTVEISAWRLRMTPTRRARARRPPPFHGPFQGEVEQAARSRPEAQAPNARLALPSP
jgi:hypothetical protein